MASTYSDRLKLELMESGANANTWGTRTNNNLNVIEAFGSGYISKSVAGSADVTLTTANSDPSTESANKVIELTGTLTGNIKVLIPAVENNYIFFKFFKVFCTIVNKVRNSVFHSFQILFQIFTWVT